MKKYPTIREMSIGISNKVDVVGRVIYLGEPQKVKRLDGSDARTVTLTLRDCTDKIDAVLLGEKASLVGSGKIKKGSIIRIRNGYIRGCGYRDTKLIVGSQASVVIRPNDPRAGMLPPLSDEIEETCEEADSEEWTTEKVRMPTFEDVVGLEDVKETVRELILRPIKHRELYDRYGIQAGGGILLYGPPGCGKTHVARAAAGELGADFFCVGISDILSKWLGESEQRIHGVFERAKEYAPSMIFFDELDALGQERDMANDCMQTVLGQLLTEMDGFDRTSDIIVVGATNHPWNVDTALTRPGRFGRSIFVPPPDRRARAELFKMYTVGRHRPVERLDSESLSKLTEGYSCADIAEICERVVRQRLKEACEAGKSGRRARVSRANMQDFEDAIRTQKPSISRWVEMVKGYMTSGLVERLFPELGAFIKGHEDRIGEGDELVHYA